MLNKTISEFKRSHINKKNQILFHTIKSNGIKETENLINNFLIEKNSFIFESVEKGKIKGRYTILGRNPDSIWEFQGKKCILSLWFGRVPKYQNITKVSKSVFQLKVSKYRLYRQTPIRTTEAPFFSIFRDLPENFAENLSKFQKLHKNLCTKFRKFSENQFKISIF